MTSAVIASTAGLACFTLDQRSDLRAPLEQEMPKSPQDGASVT